jgi:TonB family protein
MISISSSSCLMNSAKSQGAHFVVAICVVLFSDMASPAVFGATTIWVGPNGPSRAMTVDGKTITTPRGQKIPWQRDIVRMVAPEYSFWERAARHVGSGVFRIAFDSGSGATVNVTALNSTGFSGLDKSAIRAFRQWRIKPHTWKEIDIPVTFTLAKKPPALPAGATELPSPR